MNFLLMPPEVNSARIYAGAGAGTLFTAGAAWDGLASDLWASAASFDSLIAALISGPWSGPASAAMAGSAAPYAWWLAASAARAEAAAAQARAAATVFETARTATVHPAAVAANRSQLMTLVATNFLGQNTPAIAGTEFDYVEMWAQDVAAMVGYHAGARSVAAVMTAAAGAPAAPPMMAPGMAMTSTPQPTLQQVAQEVLQAAMSGAQLLSTPVGILTSPLTSLAQSAAGGAGLSAATGLAAEVPKLVDAPVPGVKPVGGGGVAGSAVSAGLGSARLVGAMSVPPTWAGSTPARTGSAAMSGLGAAQIPSATMAQTGVGGMPMMPMPMGGGGAGGGMMARGGASPHVLQNRPSVIPRAGVG